MAEVARWKASPSELTELLVETATRLEIPGAAVGVFTDGVESYAFHGVTSVENRLTVNERTLFRVGSITKTYTANAIVQLADRGEVALDQPVCLYVPELALRDRDARESVTVLQLLNHTAGWAGDFFADTGDGDDALARHVSEMATLDQEATPGASPSYNNNAFGLAGRLIERLTGKTYEAAIEELVLRPLSLNDSYFFAADVITRRFAVGHRHSSARVTIDAQWAIPRRAHAAGGLVASVADVIRYGRSYLPDAESSSDRRLHGVHRMLEPTVPLDWGAFGDSIGLAWFLRAADGVWVASHEGNAAGQRASLHLVPERGFVATVLTNADHGGQLHREIMNQLLDRIGVGDSSACPSTATEIELTEKEGCYASSQSMLLISNEGRHLAVEHKTPLSVFPARLRELVAAQAEGDFLPSPRIAVELIDDDRFRQIDGDDRGMTGGFVRDTEGSVQAIVFDGRRHTRVTS